MAVLLDYYKDFSIEDLIQDDYFIRSMRTPDEESAGFWKAFVLKYPHQQEAVEAAAMFIKQTRFRALKPEPGVKDRIWNQVMDQRPGVVVKLGRRRWMWAAAAAVMLLAATGLLQLFVAKTMVQTQYGEVKLVTLPDQSVVTLNANSTLEYNKKWEAGKPREVWLKGEGFFEVKHLNHAGDPVKPEERFIVHAGKTNVEVLGTSFNVSDRKKIVKVLLQTGSVRIDFKDRNLNSVLMKPGEVVRYDQQQKRVDKEQTDTASYTAWKRHEMWLNKTALPDVINVIENNYGYKVVLEDKALLDKQLTGTGAVSLDDEEALFKLLEVMLNVKITKEEKILHIRNID